MRQILGWERLLSSEGAEFDYQHPRSSSQLLLTLIPGNPVPSPGLGDTHSTPAYFQGKHSYTWSTIMFFSRGRQCSDGVVGRSRVLFLVFLSGGSQLPATLAAGDLVPSSGLHGSLCTYAHTGTYMHNISKWKKCLHKGHILPWSLLHVSASWLSWITHPQMPDVAVILPWLGASSNDSHQPWTETVSPDESSLFQLFLLVFNYSVESLTDILTIF